MSSMKRFSLDQMTTNKVLKILIAFIIVAFIGTLIPVMIAFLIGGFKTNMVVISNFVFLAGLVATVAGVLINIFSFSLFKLKVRRTPKYEELELKEKKDVPWGYVIFAGGVFIQIISYLIAMTL